MSAITRTVAKTTAIVTFLKGPWQVLTNRPTAAETAALVEFRESHKPAQVGVKTSVDGIRRKKDYLIEINTSDWVYPALERLNRKGINFRLGSIPIREMKNQIKQGWLSNVPKLVDGSTFAWADASYAKFLHIENSKDIPFALDLFDFFAADSKKLPKRLQEITRIVQMNSSGKFEDLSCWVLDNEELLTLDPVLTEIMVDGLVVISKSFAVKMCFKMPNGYEKRKKIAKINKGTIGRMIIRIMTPIGLIKGLAVVVPDNLNGDFDVACHGSAIKKEIGTTDGTWEATAFEHPDLHTAMWDMQSMFNNHNWLLTEERFEQDVSTVLEEFKSALASGELPSWILHAKTESHNDDGAPTMEHAVAGWKKSYQRWQAAGEDLDSSSNLVFMAYGYLKNQLEAAIRKDRWWVPMSNAFTATVNTWESLKYVAGLDLPEEKRNMVFFVENVGAVIPGDRFSETADLHDTWDQDGDQAKFIHIKLWSSLSALEEKSSFRDSYVIPADLVVPNTAEDAIDVCVVIRSPNGPGGYSIERFDADTMPWLRKCIERVPVIDLAKATPGMETLLQDVKVGEIPSSVVYTDGPLTKERAISMISAQCHNPGVGVFANLIMAHSAINRPSYPKWMPAIGNDIIDVCQQTADVESFLYLKVGFEQMWDELNESVVTKEQRIDKFVLNTRYSFSSLVLPETVEWTKENAVEGKFSCMNSSFLAMYKTVVESTRIASFERRLAGKTRCEVMQLVPRLTASGAAWASEVWTKYNRLLSQADYTRDQRIGGSTSRVYKAFVEYDRTKAIHKIVEDLYAEVANTSHPEKYAVALYRWIIDPISTGHKYGRSDRIIFQNGDDDQQTVMDLLITGIQELRNA